jgi:hypothetical protein
MECPEIIAVLSQWGQAQMTTLKRVSKGWSDMRSVGHPAVLGSLEALEIPACSPGATET